MKILLHNSKMNATSILKPSMTIRLLLMVLFFSLFGNVVNAANRFSVATGNWNSTATWSATSGGAPGASVPVAGDVVTIEGGNNVTVIANVACASLSFPSNNSNSNTLSLSGFTLNVSGDITIPRANNGGGGYINLIDVGSGTLNAGNIAFINGGGNVRHEITISTGTVYVTGNISGTNGNTSGSITFTGAGLLKVGGNMFLPANGTLTTVTGSTVEYNGTTQTVPNFDYYNLTLSGSGTKTFSGSTTISNTLSNASGVMANLGTSIAHTACSLVLNGSNQTSGTWGSMSSSASNKNNVYFGSTGIVTIGGISAIISQSTSTQTRCLSTPFNAISINVSGAGLTYQWYRNTIASNSGGTSMGTANGARTNSYTPQSTAAGINYYYCIVTNTCSSLTSAVSEAFIVNDLPSIPTLVTASSTTICDGSSLTLNATSFGNTIYWFEQTSNANGGSSNGGISIGSSASGEDFTFIPTTQSTRYYAEAISPDGCPSSSRSRTNLINLSNPPTITLQPTAPASICSGTSITLSVTATGNNRNYQWRKDGVNLSNNGINSYSGTTTANLTISNPTTSLNGSVFDVVVSRSGCSVVSNAVSFTVNPSPSATITGASGICVGSSTSLTAATPGGTWSSSNTARATVDPNGVVTGVSTGSFTITYSVTANGCTVTSQKNMSVSSAPTPVVSFSQGNLDSNLNITACQEVGGGGQNDLDILSGNPNGSTYQWQVSYDNGVSWVNAAGPTNTQNQYVLDPFYTVFTSNAGTYKFRLLIDNNGCSGVSNLLTLTVSGTSALTAGTIVGNQSSCGQSLNPAGFTSSAAGGGMGAGTYTYQWQSSIDGVNFTNIGGAILTTYDSPQINQTTYFRRSVRSGGCSAFSNVLSVLVGAPVATVTQPGCVSSTGTVTVPFPVSGITYTITGTSPVTATVTNTTGIFSGLTPGDYDVRFIAAAACISLPTSVTVNEQPLVPSMPVTTTAQPCGVPTGTITVTPQNAGETYSFDNGVTFQASNIKSGLAPGNYYVIIKNSVCNSPSKLTVINTSPTTPSTPVITSVIHPNCAVSTGTISVTVQNAGEFYSFDNGVTFQSSNIKSGLTAGNYNVIIQSTGGCNSPSKQVTINVQPLVPLAPTLTETTPTCATQTGTITITQVGVETYSFDGGAFSNVLIYSGLAQGSLHTVRAMNTGGCISPTVNISITSLTNTWTAGAWTLGTPTAEQKLIFDANYSENTNIVGCSCQVNDGKFVTIAAGRTLTLTNELKVIAPLGTLAFEDGASLVQINNVATNNNTGDIEYYRSTYSRLTDYNYLSSPVSPSIGALGPQALGEIATDLSNGTFYSYEPTATGEDWKAETAQTIMDLGKGYIATRSSAIPQANASVLPLDLIFSGIPNNGHYETSIIEDRSYLLGNPYPSALDAETFLERNSGVLNGTLYFWTHNTPMQDRNLISSTAGSGAYAYTSDDYATYNATGGVATTQLDIDPATGLPRPGSAIISSASGGIINTNIPTGKIASGQGFFASTKIVTSGNKIVFDNDMRVGVIDLTKENNSQFFKTRNPNGKTTKTKALEKNRVWLNMTNTEGAFKQTLVGYITDATNDYDDRFDGESFDGNEFIDFYSLNQDLNLTIQGRALPFDEKDEVPLGYRTTINGAFTINIAQADGLLTNQAVFIEDKLTNTVTDLKTGNYMFNTAAGTFNDRFVLKYSNKTLSVDATDKEDGILAFYSNNYKTLIIRNNLVDATVNSVALFNMLGQNIDNWDVSESEQTNVQVPIKNITSGIYIVKVKTTKGESSKKIIVN